MDLYGTGMITSKPFFLFLLISGISLFLVADHIVNYKTWGLNETYFVNDFYGYDVNCNVNYFSEPTNCRVVDENNNQIPNELLSDLINPKDCYIMENNNILPCRMN